VAATHYVLGEALDRDPFLLFELRGRGRAEVLAALRQRRAAAPGGAGQETPPAAAPPAPDAVASVSLAGARPEDYERLRGPLGSLHFRIEPPATPAALLRQLGPPPGWSLDASLVDRLAPLYAAAGALARTLALGPPEAPPGMVETPEAPPRAPDRGQPRKER
jgi:uncharacterized Zn finger protein